jgi:hypothetical protein
MHASNKKFAAMMVILVLVFAAQAYIIWTVINPVAALNARKQRGYVETAAKQSNIPIGEFQFMAEIGKTQGFENLENLKALSNYNAEVYKDAKNGDMAMAFANKMVLYRPSNSKVIYEGETPGQKQLKDQQALIQKVVNVVKTEGYLTQASTELPQVSVVANAEQLKGNAFYKGAENGDLVLTFGNENLIVLYSTKGEKVLTAAKSNLSLIKGAEEAPKKMEKTVEEEN